MMRRLGALTAIAALGVISQPAAGSGDPGPHILYVNRHGGTQAERDRLYAGKMGVVLAASPDWLLYAQWRLIKGLKVGPAAGHLLESECCGEPFRGGPGVGVDDWETASARVRGGQSNYVQTEIRGVDFSFIPNCFRDAFAVATATIKDRAARFGRRSTAVRAWLATQDAVFMACSTRGTNLPALPDHAPAWLRSDRAYQEAAFALYNGNNQEAARRFDAVAHDMTSPWRAKAPYLVARALSREALTYVSRANFLRAREALDRLDALGPAAFGHGEIINLRRSLAYRYEPDRLFGQLDQELRQAEPGPRIQYSFRDYITLSAGRHDRPEIADWIGTITWNKRVPALAHAFGRWRTTGDPAWLVASLSTVRPGDGAAAAELVRDAGAVSATSPIWLTAQYHQIRLTLATADPAGLRERLDAILARPLTRSDRNLFLSLRTQVAADLPDMMRFVLREPYCSEPAPRCGMGRSQSGGVLAEANGHHVALGAEARAILDRLPLAERMAAGRDAHLPVGIRLDLALTNFLRAVQVQDDAAVDRLSAALALLMPTMRADWQRVHATPAGADKRFAEFFALARIPGASNDLDREYIRPQGTVAQFMGHWGDWAYLAPGSPGGALVWAKADGYGGWESFAVASDAETHVDLSCFGMCGSSASIWQAPRFSATLAPRAAAERRRELSFGSYYEYERDGARKAMPAGARSMWEELLDYAAAHPHDPRAPEALYWIGRISRFGAHHGGIGHRSFALLHQRYPGSIWTKRTPYYFD